MDILLSGDNNDIWRYDQVSSFFKDKSKLGATCSFKENMTNFKNLFFWLI